MGRICVIRVLGPHYMDRWALKDIFKGLGLLFGGPL